MQDFSIGNFFENKMQPDLHLNDKIGKVILIVKHDKVLNSLILLKHFEVKEDFIEELYEHTKDLNDVDMMYVTHKKLAEVEEYLSKSEKINGYTILREYS